MDWSIGPTLGRTGKTKDPGKRSKTNLRRALGPPPHGMEATPPRPHLDPRPKGAKKIQEARNPRWGGGSGYPGPVGLGSVFTHLQDGGARPEPHCGTACRRSPRGAFGRGGVHTGWAQKAPHGWVPNPARYTHHIHPYPIQPVVDYTGGSLAGSVSLCVGGLWPLPVPTLTLPLANQPAQDRAHGRAHILCGPE